MPGSVTLRDFPRPDRKGAVLPIVAVFLVVFLAMAAYSVDIAYMELVRTQLRAATDSAAKAGASAIVQGQSTSNVIAAAINMASLNTVAGKPLVVTSSDISLGQSVLQADGTYQFVAGLTPYQSVQVTASLSSSNANGRVPLFFAPFFGVETYSPTNTAAATAVATDVCLVLDRSNSMCWDESGTTFSYPSPIGTNIPLGIQTPPQSGSRWIALQGAVQSFCSVITGANGATNVGVVTWASPITTSSPEYILTGQTSPGVSTDLNLSSNMTSVYSAVYAHSQNVMMGGTDMASGINGGTAVLTGSSSRTFANKVMILMTDGQWNVGVDPTTAAATAKASNITIHCICFLPSADQTTCQEIASSTGGKFYYATNSAALAAAFQEIAYSLPVALIQ